MPKTIELNAVSTEELALFINEEHVRLARASENIRALLEEVNRRKTQAGQVPANTQGV